MAFSPMNYYPGYTGQQSYDPYAFETEEERRRREEEERLRIERETPVKQTIEIDPTTGAQKVKIEGSAYNLSSANPMTPTVSGPAIPEGVQVAGPADAAFQRMRQVESGNRDYDEQGRPITSPKGAMFASQVMPATAANPGYGVAPAANQTPEEYNRVGREYYDAMLKKYGGDERLAQAAYNAGPGRVDNAVQVATAQGGDALQYLPRETQQYTQKVAAVSPEQLAQQQSGQANVPATRPAVNQETGEQYQQMVPGVNMGTRSVSTAQTAANQGQAAPPPTFEQQFEAAQNDLNGMRKLLRSAPPQYQTAIEDRVIELAQREKAQAAVQQRVAEAVASGDMRGLTKEMNKNTAEGSLMKAFLLKTFGMEEAAQKESARALGTDVRYRTTRDPETGQSALIGVDRFTGLPVRGFDATGVSLTPEQLSRFNAGALAGKVTTGAEFFTDNKGNIYSPQRDESGYTRMVNSTTNQVYSGSEPLQRLRDVAAVDVKGKTTAIQAAKERMLSDYNAGLKAFATTQQMLAETGQQLMSPADLREAGVKEPDIQSIMRVVPGQGGAPGPGAVSATGAVAPVFPQVGGAASGSRADGKVAPSGEPAAPAKPRTVQEQKKIAEEEKARLQTRTAGEEKIVKDSAEVVANAGKYIADIERSNRAIDILDNKKTNFGPILGGILPGEQTIGKALGTADARNTQKVMEVVNKLNAAGAKTLGANPTDRDLAFLIGNTPDESWEPADVKEWIQDTSAAIKRNIDIAKEQIKTGGRYVPEVPEVGGNQPAAAGTTSSGNKYKRVQ